jgi:hypothetical protein
MVMEGAIAQCEWNRQKNMYFQLERVIKKSEVQAILSPICKI